MVHNTKAYTLIELTVVIFLIGIMLALAVPRVRDSWLSDNLKAATRRMIGTIKTLNDKAVREGKDYRLYFDVESDRYWVEWDLMTAERRAEARQNAKSVGGNVDVLDVDYGSGGKKEMGEAVIHFTKKGYVEPATIHLGTKDGRSEAIELSPFLGII